MLCANTFGLFETVFFGLITAAFVGAGWGGYHVGRLRGRIEGEQSPRAYGPFEAYGDVPSLDPSWGDR
jgi:hypothetical protein